MLSLKEAISEKHSKAEKIPFNKKMLAGLLSQQDYLVYLNQELQIFKTIEGIGVPHASLNRAEKIAEDINELNTQGNHSDLILQSTKAYSDYLSKLTYEQVLPHVYLNYMGIMFGGQMIKKAVPSTGKMYAFDHLKEAIQSIREVMGR